MAIAIDASNVDAMMPNAGTPRLDISLKRSGNRPSFAAASGISAQIIVHPFSAPRPEMMTMTDIKFPQNVPPNMELIASEKGAVELANVVDGRMPNIAINDSM